MLVKTFECNKLKNSTIEFSPYHFCFEFNQKNVNTKHFRLTNLADKSFMTFQISDLREKDGLTSGKISFLSKSDCHITYELDFNEKYNSDFSKDTGLNWQKCDKGPFHYLIENDFYKVETEPKSGQVWHLWNKLGTNRSWHHNEWAVNDDKGGDPCHWAPNCWAGHPDRITNGYEMKFRNDIDFIDWHYVFGWRQPEIEIIRGPVFIEIKRRGVVWPHPDHCNENISYDQNEKIFAEVCYRFYDGVPWFFQSSRIETLCEVPVFFIRNSQFVFLAEMFTHAVIAGENKDLLPGDETEAAVLKLMANIRRKPFPNEQHNLSNILPSKLAYTGFFHEDNGDGFLQIQKKEHNYNKNGSEPIYQNHCTLFTELSDWALYFCRAFSYSNARFNPENMIYLPAGEVYEEENICLFYQHKTIPETKDYLHKVNAQLNEDGRVET